MAPPPLGLYLRCRAYTVIPYSYRMMQIATWIPKYGLVYSNKDEPFPKKFKKMIDGANLNVATVTFLPHFSMNSTGPIVTVLKMLANKVNFTYTIIPESSYGYLLPNGTWNGLVGLVLRKDADIGLGPLAITYGRSKVIDYTEPILVDYLVIEARRGGIEIDPWSFALPFTASVWASLCATFILAIITAVVFAQGAKEWSSSTALPFNYYRVLMFQDVDDIKLSWWEKMIIGSWMITVLVALESYSGNLMSQLAVRYIAQPYQSLRDVLDDPKIKMMWVSNTFYVQLFKSSTSGILQEVAKSEEYGKMTYVDSNEYFAAMNTLVARGDHVSVNPYLTTRYFLTEGFTDGDVLYLSEKNIFRLKLTRKSNCNILRGPV
ncbi:probable glutamate receptor [Palaemon carinicauda]|uniref:probable glutamate receptor n=1 Tax=Palaemon carinicauda TaxID=392227 RepID=UPI0035B5BBD6